jgi:hypothetical protein
MFNVLIYSTTGLEQRFNLGVKIVLSLLLGAFISLER